MIVHRKFDRIARFDPRSRAYGVRAMVVDARRSVLWPCAAWLDQGSEGACVGFGLAHELAAEPAVSRVTGRFARERIYHEAQRIDEFDGGAYPGARPRTEGTSLLAGLKVVRSLGACDSYLWAFGIDDLIDGLQGGPAVLGLTWREGMMAPGRGGLVTAAGLPVGGHCILCRGWDRDTGLFRLRNSWGQAWGDNGDCLVTSPDMRRLLLESGEAAFLVGRHVIDTDHLPPLQEPRPWWARLWGWIRRAVT